MKDLGNGIKIQKEVFTDNESDMVFNVEEKYKNISAFSDDLRRVNDMIDNVLEVMYMTAKDYKVNKQQYVTDTMLNIQLARDTYINSIKEVLHRDGLLYKERVKK